MNDTTIKKLNQLNKDFYTDLSEQFSDSRKYYWKGWEKLLSNKVVIGFKDKEIKVLDLGCGNGRFARFIVDNGFSIEYLGVDHSDELLLEARNYLQDLSENHKIAFQDMDLLRLDQIDGEYDLIVLFGVLHHIPGHTSRTGLLRKCSELLVEGGLLVYTVWDFPSDKKLMKKIVDPEQVGVSYDQLESNDYILDWKRGGVGYRYCHFTDVNEAEELNNGSGLRSIENYVADGRSGELNRYYILKK